jgi:hypothetical protein
MKNFTQIKWILLFVVFASNAQQEKGIIGSSNWLNNWTQFKPLKAVYNETDQILYGKIDKDRTLEKKNTYLLQGPVYVTNGATLTIEPGTVIKGDFETVGALIITKGSKIIADGKETDPIVFTSNRPSRKSGDWGGVVILGDAPINKFGGSASVNFDLDATLTIYGGTNPQASSGVLRFVRIEFAGKKVKGFKDFNALSIAGVGSKTIIDNVMCSYANSDSYEILGGSLNLSKMISLRANGNDFKFNQGTQCKIDNSLAVRHSYYSTPKRARCFDVASYDKKEDADFSKGLTNVIASNCTMVNSTETLTADRDSGLVKEAIFVNSNAGLSLNKTVISGFSPAIVMDDEITMDAPTMKKYSFREVFFNSCKGYIFMENTTDNSDIEDYYATPAFFNLYENLDNKNMFIDAYNIKTPDFRIQIGKITASK